MTVGSTLSNHVLNLPQHNFILAALIKAGARCALTISGAPTDTQNLTQGCYRVPLAPLPAFLPDTP
jgi:hypothetical protein